ncbi:hypothetical protein ACQ4PT_052218 [Festuca glaucescens]
MAGCGAAEDCGEDWSSPAEYEEVHGDGGAPTEASRGAYASGQRPRPSPTPAATGSAARRQPHPGAKDGSGAGHLSPAALASDGSSHGGMVVVGDREVQSSSEEEEELKGAKCWYWEAASEGKHEEVEQLQPNDNDDGDKENVPYGDQLTEQASNRQDENMKQLENNENAPEKVVERQNKVNAEQGESSREPFIGHLE